MQNQPQPLVQIMGFSFNPNFAYEQQTWKQSDFGQEQGRVYDKQIRNSQYKFANMSKFTHLPFANQNKDQKWRIIRYNDGHFQKHFDQRKSAEHIGTEILIFPKCQSEHKQGKLLIFKDQKTYIEVSAQPFVYTYVFIPLGYQHEITNIQGIRTVATRMVTGKQKLIQKEAVKTKHILFD